MISNNVANNSASKLVIPVKNQQSQQMNSIQQFTISSSKIQANFKQATSQSSGTQSSSENANGSSNSSKLVR